jgi:hypothetical protein
VGTEPEAEAPTIASEVLATGSLSGALPAQADADSPNAQR